MASVFFVNKYGIGVNGTQADSTIALNVKGAANVSNILNSNLVGGSGAHGSTKVSDLNNIWKSGFYDIYQGANQPFGGWNWVINCAHTNNKDGYKYGFQIAAGNNEKKYAMRSTNANGEGSWSVLYHTHNKPSAADVGALPITGGTLTGKLQIKNADANTDNSSYLELYRANGVRGSLITSHNNGLGIRLHTYDAEGTWSSNYVFNTDGTFEANKLKMGNAFLDSSTLRLEKGYGGNYSQIFFKGQTNDDGRIIH